MILKGEKVSIGTDKEKIIKFLTNPKNFELLLPMEKSKTLKAMLRDVRLKFKVDL